MQQGACDRAPLLQRALFADPVNSQRIVAARENPRRARAAQNVDDLCRPKALSALREARNARQELPRFDAPILHRSRFAAVVAGAARTCKLLVEVAQQDRAPAFGRFGIIEHLAQLAPRDSLLLLERGAADRVELLLNQIVGRADVGGAEIQQAARRVTVAAGAARLLIIGLQALR